MINGGALSANRTKEYEIPSCDKHGGFLLEGWCVEKDIRTLCASCLNEYQRAGYKLKLIWSFNKEECDRCRIKYGWTYEIEPVLFEKQEKK